MELSFGEAIEFIVTSGLYLVIIGNFVRVIRKGNSNKKKYSNDMVTPNMKNERRYDKQVLYDEEPRKGMKKQSVFTSMMQQVDKISDSFETVEKKWSKGQKSTSINVNVDYPIPERTVAQTASNQKIEVMNKNTASSKIYEPLSEIKDMKECVHEDRSTILKFKKNEIKKAIIMKEILDKPLAYKQVRR